METVGVGLIVGCHGLRGELKVQYWTDDPGRFDELEEVLLEGEEVPRSILGWRFHKGHVLLTLEGVGDRTQAEALRKKRLLIPAQDRRELPEGRWYHDDLAGLEVRDLSGEKIGEVDRFEEETVSGGLLAVRLDAGGWLDLPFADVWVPEIHVEEGYLTVAANWRQLRDLGKS
jgi:16S rRNA processing protein RimM